MNTLRQIESEIANLPVNLQSEVLDFVRFVKSRRGLPTAEAQTPQAHGGDSAFFQALTQVGLVGCMDTPDQLSTRYKSLLDFSSKVGAQPGGPT